MARRGGGPDVKRLTGAGMCHLPIESWPRGLRADVLDSPVRRFTAGYPP